ncbi:MAG: hypothetical protein HFI33_00615 [Lachnospiraceae bacterium]|nr:hypothetical protein [Lachnospiraceae bacterium]
MASSVEFVEFVTGQLSQAGRITSKKMFGEYGIYCDGLLFAVICDNQFFVKATQAGKDLLGTWEEAAPYKGSKPYLLIGDLEDRDLLTKLVQGTLKELPPPKEKKQGTKVDYKKDYRDLYQPKRTPMLIQVPKMQFLMVDGEGDPNTSASYKEALEILYGLSFGIKMSKLSGQAPQGYFEYVVPPLEGLWWQEDGDISGTSLLDKENFHWTSLIRQPEFVTPQVLEIAKNAFQKKRPNLPLHRVRLCSYTEGLCAQVMHVGSYDAEPETIERLKSFIQKKGCALDINQERKHHEIYLGDPRRTAPEKLKTVIRLPVVQK